MTVEEWCCGIATTCSCRASDLGSSEHGEHISPCVSGNQRETHTVRICAICAEDRHIDENCRNLEDQSYTCKVRRRDRDASTQIDGRPEFTLDWWSEAACCWWERQVVCSEKTEHKIVSIPVQSSPVIQSLRNQLMELLETPRLEARVLDSEPFTSTETICSRGRVSTNSQREREPETIPRRHWERGIHSWMCRLQCSP